MAAFLAQLAIQTGWVFTGLILKVVTLFLAVCFVAGAMTAWVGCAEQPAPRPDIRLLDPCPGGRSDPNIETGCSYTEKSKDST